MVIRPFIDKYTRKGYNKGNVFKSTDIERVSFLIDAGYLAGEKPQVQQVPDGQQDDVQIDAPDNEQPEDTQSPTDPLAELVATAKSLKIKGYTKMNEEELRKAIEAAHSKKVGE